MKRALRCRLARDIVVNITWQALKRLYATLLSLLEQILGGLRDIRVVILRVRFEHVGVPFGIETRVFVQAAQVIGFFLRSFQRIISNSGLEPAACPIFGIFFNPKAFGSTVPAPLEPEPQPATHIKHRADTATSKHVARFTSVIPARFRSTGLKKRWCDPTRGTQGPKRSLHCGEARTREKLSTKAAGCQRYIVDSLPQLQRKLTHKPARDQSVSALCTDSPP